MIRILNGLLKNKRQYGVIFIEPTEHHMFSKGYANTKAHKVIKVTANAWL